MRFDIELPATDNIKIVFISEDDGAIPNSVVPLLYCDVDTKDMFPSDFISIEPGFKPIESSTGGYSKFIGPVILNAKSDKFLLTNKIKYRQNGQLVPLFYKHIINNIIKDEAIKIIDYFNVELSKDQYLVEENNGQTFIYINKQDKAYFVSYTIGNKIDKSFLNLSTVYQEASIANILNGELDDFYYIYLNNNIATSYNGDLYVSYISDSRLVRTAYGNIEDSWNLGILNADFISNETGLRYWIPEYYTQNLNNNNKYRLVSDKKCKKIFSNYIKSQYSIAKDNTDSLAVYVFNFYSKKLKYAFTESEALVNTLYSKDDMIYYQKLTSFNFDGVISLPIEIEDDDIVYATHFTDDDYYEYSGVTLNSNVFDSADYFVIYIKPNVPDTDSAVRYAIIGSEIENISTLYFDTIEDFYYEVDNNQDSECYKSYIAAIISVTNLLENAGIDFVDVSSVGGYIKDKKEISKIDPDIIYNDLINNLINFPTSDALIADLDISRLLEDGRFISDQNMSLNAFADSFIKNVYKTIKNNLDVSTFPIIKLNIETLKDDKLNLITSKYYIGE